MGFGKRSMEGMIHEQVLEVRKCLKWVDNKQKKSCIDNCCYLLPPNFDGVIYNSHDEQAHFI